MSRQLVILGASGDLMSRKLTPALARLQITGQLPADFAVLGVARDEWDRPALQRRVADDVAKHAPDVDQATIAAT